MISNYILRQNDGKLKATQALKSLNYTVIAIGDSYNDISMLQAADKGILFKPPENVQNEFPELPAAHTYADLKGVIENTLK
jgi:phosphoserine/homoserine phosphotransferase